MQYSTAINGAIAAVGGYWADPDGHHVYLCQGQPLPACPRQPFLTTFWTLETEIPCPGWRNDSG